MKIKLPIKSKKYNLNRFYGKDKNIMILLVISITVSAIIFLLAVLSFLDMNLADPAVISGMDFATFGILSVIGPIGFYSHLKVKKKKEIENHMPDFLREISSSTSSGMTIYDAITSAADGDYGRLTPELQKMAAQLSWGISVKEALINFAKRINTASIKRIVVTINKALEIGGNTSAVFEAAAREIDQTKLVEQQRKAEMSLYSIVIFISFFVFLAVILIINNTIFAAFFELQSQMGGQKISNLEIAGAVDQGMLKNTFFSFVLVQSIGGGLLGGFMMDGKLSSGVRFGFVLVLVSFFVFKILF
ncbi:MAG: type II secretion system F family protein [Thermoplasmatales archaeon]|nr:type II secretion system F family protein [Thermoplasmatales archaeon]